MLRGVMYVSLLCSLMSVPEHVGHTPDGAISVVMCVYPTLLGELPCMSSIVTRCAMPICMMMPCSVLQYEYIPSGWSKYMRVGGSSGVPPTSIHVPNGTLYSGVLWMCGGLCLMGVPPMGSEM